MKASARPLLMAEFDSPRALLTAVSVLRARGVSRLDTFTPYRVEGLEAALGRPPSRLPWIVLAAGLAGGGGAYALEWWINVVDYPLNIGGRPLHSALAFVPIAWAMAVLCASGAAFLAAVLLGGLPSLWHPVFEIEGFERATIDRFWLAVGQGEPNLERGRDSVALVGAGARQVVWLGDEA
jgi:hypothetical protein